MSDVHNFPDQSVVSLVFVGVSQPSLEFCRRLLLEAVFRELALRPLLE